MSAPLLEDLIHADLSTRVRLHRIISGVPGARYTVHETYEEARTAFREARRRRITRRVPPPPPPHQVIVLSDDDSETILK